MAKSRDIDAAKLANWLNATLGDRAPLAVEPMQGGGSCEVFDVRRAEAHWVLRRAPTHASSDTAHDVLREFRILDAIKDRELRIARPVAACDDPEVAGTPFYLMEHVDGVPIRQTLPPAYASAPEQQGRVLEELMDALAQIHCVDWQACGLAGIGKPEGFLERQVPRWLDQLAGYQERELPAVDRLAVWLRENLPAEQPPSLFHGDYKLDNALYARDLPPRLLAVVDWEMASLGDPLVDLAWALIFFPEPGNTLALGSPGADNGFRIDALPSRDALLERYASRSGRDLAQLYWYEVFSPWKLAIVLEGSYAKHLRGESKKPLHAFFGSVVDTLLERAESRASGDAEK